MAGLRGIIQRVNPAGLAYITLQDSPDQDRDFAFTPDKLFVRRDGVFHGYRGESLKSLGVRSGRPVCFSEENGTVQRVELE